MKDLKVLLDSNNILEDILSMEDKELFKYFSELSNLDFFLNKHGMVTEHKFSVLDHTKRTLKNFQQALRFRNNPKIIETELVGGTTYKKLFFKRVVEIINELHLEPSSNDFKSIVIALLLHDIGKGSYDKTEKEIIEMWEEYKSKGIKHPIEYLKLLFRSKDHEERGAFLAYSRLEEVQVSQSFANHVKNLIMGHADLNKFQEKDGFNLLMFLRRIMDYATDYNYPIIYKPNPLELIINELNMNYLVYLFDVYSVDDTGKVWYSVHQKKETIYLRAKWFLGKKIKDLLVLIQELFPNDENGKLDEVSQLIKKNFLQSMRTNTPFLLGSEIKYICNSKESDQLLSLIHDYFDHCGKMLPRYLDQTTPQEKQCHIDLLTNAHVKFNYSFNFQDEDLEITVVRHYAQKGTLLKLVKSLIDSSIECGRRFKITNLSAYSGEDGRLIDIFHLKSVIDEKITEDMIEVFKKNISKCNDPNFKIEKLDIEITREYIDSLVRSVHVELQDVQIGARKFQELKIKANTLSNLILYSCLTALNYINIFELKVEEEDGNFLYIFILTPFQQYRINSTFSFKSELITHLSQNIFLVEGKESN